MVSENAREFKVEDRIQIVARDLEQSWPELLRLGPYDIILADPPYEAGWESKLLSLPEWNALLTPGGVFCLEWSPLKAGLEQLPPPPPGLEQIREKAYGDSVLTTFARTSG
jgi:16S rRNA G966 N2-methylase RsmD